MIPSDTGLQFTAKAELIVYSVFLRISGGTHIHIYGPVNFKGT